jgi:hypothetical protein
MSDGRAVFRSRRAEGLGSTLILAPTRL